MPYLEYVKKNIVAMNTGGKELHKMGYKGIFYLDNEKKDFIITESNLEAALVAAGAVYRFYFRHFGVNANLNVGLNELKLSLMQGRVNATAEKRCFDTSITGNNNGSRIGENSKWTPQKADRQYGVTVCMDYDRALVSLMTLQYRRFIEYGMIDGMCSCVR